MSSHVSDRGGQGTANKAEDEVRTHIGERLRAHYDAVLKEPIPNRFMELLQQLDHAVDPVAESAGADHLLRDIKVREGHSR